MASRSRHLDATGDREVVYCHACENEWYKDEHPDSLTCLECHGDITEIISPGNDPRSMDGGHLHLSRGFRQHPDNDSDPDEEDIEEFVSRGPGGFFGRRSIHRLPERQDRTRMNPDNGEDIIRRFTEMLGDMGGPGEVGRSGPETLFHQDAPRRPRVTVQRIYGPGVSGGMSSVTIATGPHFRRSPPTGQEGLGPEDPFQSVFSQLLGQAGPPPNNTRQQEDANANAANRGENQSAVATALTQLLASFLSPNAVHGDAVYSQEALDRIMTTLMDAHPQSNAPAPASEGTIKHLPRKKLDEEMLGPDLKGDCSICIENMNAGDEAMVLPCAHWFHEDCVSAWLKLHDSCPICRAPVDGEAAGQAGAAAPNPQLNTQPGSPPVPSASRPSAAESRRSNIRQRSEARLDSIRDAAGPWRRHSSRRDSNSPPAYHASAQYSPRVRSPSPTGRRSAQNEPPRDGRASSSSGPLNWLRDRFSGDRRS
ncbi:hypothetical protein F5Y15DRAFT_361087 [Xylariaceae sp. FL0016]|nr:hypothetical protein F5Y15DRAFT_361087 [Xylariaceae sp. FL0016]